MKIYEGFRDENDIAKVRVTTIGDFPKGVPDDVRLLKHVCQHSPTGFEWGYSGSGPADLALSLLFDHFGETPQAKGRASQIYQAFKVRCVALLPRQGWTIDTAYIDEILNLVYYTTPNPSATLDGFENGSKSEASIRV